MCWLKNMMINPADDAPFPERTGSCLLLDIPGMSGSLPIFFFILQFPGREKLAYAQFQNTLMGRMLLWGVIIVNICEL